jgi:hypothetical protein
MSFGEKCEFLRKAYKGETPVEDLTGTEFEGLDTLGWIKWFIDQYGGFDGAHHKDWVLDQVMRIAHGTPVGVTKKVWHDEESGYYNEQLSVRTGPPSEEYTAYVAQYTEGEYDAGIAP